jgi:hypothetical protein
MFFHGSRNGLLSASSVGIETAVASGEATAAEVALAAKGAGFPALRTAKDASLEPVAGVCGVLADAFAFGTAV